MVSSEIGRRGELKLGLVWPKSSLAVNPDIANDPHMGELLSAYYSRNGHKPFPSVGGALPLIAALTPDAVDQIVIIDGSTEEIPFDAGFDLIGISMMTAQATEGYRIAGEFRRRGVHVALGGIHPTIMPYEATNHADTVIVGEAEYTWPTFIGDFLKGRPQRLYRQTEPIDLEQSPVPRYDLLRAQSRDGYAFIQTSRGCPNNCEYCSINQVYGPHYRYKSMEQVIDEIRAAQGRNPSTKLFFSDDNMFVDRRRAKRMMEALIPLSVTWATQADVKIAEDDEALDLMSASGCEYLFVGLESVTEEGISSLSKWKRKHFHYYLESIRKIQSRGISVLGAFIVGTDDHDDTVFDRLIRFTQDASIQKTHISVLTPLPGTALRQRLQAQTRLIDRPWSNYDFFGVNYKPKKITSQRLQHGLLETMIHFCGNA